MWADELFKWLFSGADLGGLVWDLGVDLWVNIERYWIWTSWQVYLSCFFGWFLAGCFSFKRFFESAKFPNNAEAFWCGLSNHARSDLLYLGPYGFQIFSTSSWDSKASCDNESFGGHVVFSPKAVGHQSVVLGLSPASAYKAWIIWDYSDSNETVILEYPNSSQ